MGRPRSKRINAACVSCGKEIQVKEYDWARGRGRACSITCRNSIGGKAAIKQNRPVGPMHYLWKGGRVEAKKRFRVDPIKARAREAVGRAVRNGKMKRKPCVVCGETKSEGHHEDYSKPLDVIWLCRKHHKEADRKLGVATGDFK